jgi:hypothetical protein
MVMCSVHHVQIDVIRRLGSEGASLRADFKMRLRIVPRIPGQPLIDNHSSGVAAP